MTEQFRLWHDDIYDALATLVAALGGAQEVGVHLRPEWEGKPDQAGRWVKDCINRNRADKFDFDQIFWLLREGRKIGCHVATYHICREAGYGDPLPVEPEDELAALQREFLEAARGQDQRMDRIEKLLERMGK